MSSTLMKSVSGIRGVVGDSLTPEVIYKTGVAMARFTRRGTIILGRDTRPTGAAVARGITSTLVLAGCDVIDIGVVPTPTVQVMVEELRADGGIVISASHNPVQWNAFKLINKEGTFLDQNEINRFFGYMEAPITFPRWDAIGSISDNSDAEQIHLNRVMRCVNVEAIRKRKFTVVLDSVNGAGSIITPRLLSDLGCRVIPVNCEPDGLFPRGAEPLPENLAELSRQVARYRADIGLAQDPDADRLAVVNEKGIPIGEEYTIALVVDHILRREKGRVVVNLSTTKAVEDIAKIHGVPFTRAKVGEINVVKTMKKMGAVIGGEGNGGVISPEVHYGRDSLAGICYLLEMLAEREATVSQLVSRLPQYSMKKGKVSYDPLKFSVKKLEKITKSFRGEKISDKDGLRIDFNRHRQFKGGWVHLRPSNTEPVFRIIAEGKDQKQMKEIYAFFAGIIS